MAKEPRISIPVSVAKDLIDQYDAWAGSLPEYDERSNTYPRQEWLDEHAALRDRINRLGGYEE